MAFTFFLFPDTLRQNICFEHIRLFSIYMHLVCLSPKGVVGNLLWGSLEEFSFGCCDGISQIINGGHIPIKQKLITTFVKVTFIKLKIFIEKK